MKRDSLGRFKKTNGNQRYKNCQVNGVIKGKHVAVWEEYNNKKVPSRHLIHHIDFNKFNNNIDNLECVTYKKHNKIHAHIAWNKGKTTHHGNNVFGHKVSKKSIIKSNIRKFNSYLDSYIEIWKLKT